MRFADRLRDAWRLPALLAAGLAAWSIAALLLSFLRRLAVPVEFDWVESAVLVAVRRVLDGEGLFVEPTTEFAPFPYGPLYFQVAALVSAVVGEGFLAGRLVSVLSIAGSLLLIGRMVQLETGSRLAAFVAAGVFASLCPLTRFAYDMARVDSLFVLLVLASAQALRFHPGRKGLAAAIVLSTLAMLTKQTALLPAVALAGWLALMEGRKGLVYGGLLLGALGLVHGVMHAATGGWSTYYLFTMPSAHPRLGPLYSEFLVDELLIGLGLAAALAIYALVPLRSDDAARRRQLLFHAFLLLSVFVATLLPRVKAGGNSNNLIPLCAVIAIGAGLGLGRAWAASRWKAAAAGLVLVAFGFQHVYLPGRYDLPPGHRRDAEADLAAFRTLPDKIFAPCHGYVALQAGKGKSAFWSTMIDAFMTPQEQRQRLYPRLQEELTRKKFGAVVLYRAGFYQMDRFPMRELEASYRRLEAADAAKGWIEGPSMAVYVPRD